MGDLFDLNVNLIVNPEKQNPYEVFYNVLAYEKEFEKRLKNVIQSKKMIIEYDYTLLFFGLLVFVHGRDHQLYRNSSSATERVYPLKLNNQAKPIAFKTKKAASQFKKKLKKELVSFLSEEQQRYKRIQKKAMNRPCKNLELNEEKYQGLIDITYKLVANPEKLLPFELHYNISIHDKGFAKRFGNVMKEKYRNDELIEAHVEGSPSTGHNELKIIVKSTVAGKYLVKRLEKQLLTLLLAEKQRYFDLVQEKCLMECQ